MQEYLWDGIKRAIFLLLASALPLFAAAIPEKLTITIPPNVTASLKLPIKSTEIPKSIGSGKYTFTGKYAN